MIWTRRLMRTAFIFLVTMTMLANESDANIRAEWAQLTDGQPMDRVRVLETDGFRLYAAAGIRAESGLYISRDNGYTWNPTELNHSVNTIAIDQNTLYAGGDSHGVFRSDNLGDTWKPINNGIRTINVDNGEIRLPYIEQILVTSSGTGVAVGYHSGTHTSTDRCDTWDDVTLEWKVRQRVAPDWIIGDSIWSMIEFDGYLWAVYSSTSRFIFRSTDNGQTWEYTREQKYGQIADWSVLNGRLYAGTRNGLARWNETQPAWEYFSEGLPVLSIGATASIKSLTVYRGRLFAGLYDHAGAEGGVYMFDDRIDTFVPAGLQGSSVSVLIFHQSELYAAVDDKGIYRASIPTVLHPYAKAATTWVSVKQGGSCEIALSAPMKRGRKT